MNPAEVLASVSWLVLCAHCASSLESFADGRNAARIEAIDADWRLDEYGEWWCPSCARGRDEETDAEWVALHVFVPGISR